MLRNILTLAALPVFAAQIATAETYKIDPVHSQIGFTVDHLVVFKVSGSFNDYIGEIEADAENKTLTSAKATIKVASIDTREEKRNDHLKSADFFDSANHPEMTFVSKKIDGQGDDITVHGDLTIRGITKEVALKGNFRGVNTDPWGNDRAGFSASTVINRQDFGLKWNQALETGGLVVGNDVTINLEVQAVKL